VVKITALSYLLKHVEKEAHHKNLPHLQLSFLRPIKRTTPLDVLYSTPVEKNTYITSLYKYYTRRLLRSEDCR
jgi:hypothetical protein